ncbi:MAG: hypothetical protein LBP63_11490 [Prevotellaceae bacterium]|jgi:hypothetical protein|nr:hypothetical protein [Prevotellaceae bacterium]
MVKKINLILAAVTMLAAISCSNEDMSTYNEGMVDFTVKTSIPHAIQTYASHNGGATNVDASTHNLRYILEVWTKETPRRLAYRAYEVVDDNFTGQGVTFSARLLAMEYDFVFWADFVENTVTKANAASGDYFYKTNNGETADDIKAAPTAYPGLKEIELKSADAYEISDDARDAYYAVKSVDLRTQSQIGSVTLKRPFGKFRLVSLDAVDGYIATPPAKAKINYTTASFPSGFNALTSEATSPNLNLTEKNLMSIVKTENAVVGGVTYSNANILAVDYLFAAPAQTAAFNVTVYNSTSEQIGYKEISNIPVVANKLTTIIGHFFSNAADYTVIVDDEFDDYEDVDVTDEINGDITADYTITVPENTTTPVLTYIFTGTIANNVTISILDENSSNPYTGTVQLLIQKDTEASVDINLPGASVIFKGKVGSMSAVTSDNTLTIAKGAKVSTLAANGGNVKIYGTVNSLTKLNSTDKIYLAIGLHSDRLISNTVVKDALAVDFADGLIFTEGHYPLNRNIYVNIKDQNYYMPVTKEGYHIIGEGNVNNIVVYGDEYTANAAHGTQNLVTVFAPDVTIENITFMPKSDPNKVLEVISGADNFKLSGCKFIPNIIKGYGNCAGNIWVDGNNSELDGNTFTYAGITVRENKTSTITNNTFNYGSSSWAEKSCISVRGTATVENNTFNDIRPISPLYTDMPIFAHVGGTINLNINTYPTTDEIYWTAVEGGTIILNGTEISYTDVADLQDKINGGGTVFLRKAQYDITNLVISNDVVILGGGAKLSAVSPAAQTVPVNGANPAIFIIEGNVTLKGLAITTAGTPLHKSVDGVTILNGTLTVEDVIFDGIISTNPTGDQYGRCITAYGNSQLTVTNSIFKRYNKNGIHLYGTSDAQISGCSFIGNNILNVNGQNGIVFMRNGSNVTTGKVSNCIFKDIIYDSAIACAVLIYGTNSNDVVDGGGNTYDNCDRNWYAGL